MMRLVIVCEKSIYICEVVYAQFITPYPTSAVLNISATILFQPYVLYV
jgi:hypothetical protein